MKRPLVAHPGASGMRTALLASSLRKTWIRAANRDARVELHEPVYFGPGCTLDLAPSASFVAHERAHLRRGCVVEVNGHGRVEIGADTQLTYNVVIQCSTEVKIGARCLIGATLIVDGNHRFEATDMPIGEQGYDFRPITIGDDVFIGMGAVVMADVGERAVVGANAVVVEPVPAYSIVAGVPAKVIRRLGEAG